MINSSFKTTIDVQRQTRNFYARANLLIRNFRYCSTDNVKCYLFQSYCTSMYCCQLWFNSTKGSLKKLKTSYNSALRRFLVISKPYGASQMFVSRGILSFDELLRKSIYRSQSEVRSQKFYLNIYTYTKLSNIFLDITFNRLNVMKIYMYSLYVYISRRLQ